MLINRSQPYRMVAGPGKQTSPSLVPGVIKTSDMNVLFDKDPGHKKITITFSFNASLDKAWNAFTNPEMLEKWFAPYPYKAITKSFDFKEGGYWLYYMLSPQGEKFWSITRYQKIEPGKYFEISDAFCDEHGTIDTSLPQLKWRHKFSEKDGTATVHMIITSENEKDMAKILEMGFEEGYKMGLNQLQEIL